MEVGVKVSVWVNEDGQVTALGKPVETSTLQHCAFVQGEIIHVIPLGTQTRYKVRFAEGSFPDLRDVVWFFDNELRPGTFAESVVTSPEVHARAYGAEIRAELAIQIATEFGIPEAMDFLRHTR